MFIFFEVVYLSFGLITVFYGLKSEKSMQHAFTFALAVNVFPVAIMPQLSMAEARLGGVPLAYIPIMCAGIPFIIHSIRHINSNLASLIVMMAIFVFYITLNSFYPDFHIGTLVYYFSWIFNFILYIVVFSYFSNQNSDCVNDVLSTFFYTLIIACCVGIVRYIIGLAGDANFMPMVNRNGTVVFLVMASSLLFYLSEIKVFNFKKVILFWLVIAITLLLMQSRSGLVGFIVISCVYYFRFSLNSFITLSMIIIVLTIILVSPIGEKVSNRFAHTEQSIVQAADGGISAGENDYARYMLMKSAIEIFKNNPLMGVGVGVPNYRAGFKEHVDFYSRDSKAHNFYLSYLAELGIIGFLFLLLILSKIYRILAPLKGPYRAFKVSFLGISLMMTMNEYILLPELWFFYGMLGGMSFVVRSET